MYKYSDFALKQIKKASLNFWTNKTFNNCTILEPIDLNKTNANSKWKIKCFCGNIFECKPGNLQSGNTKSCKCDRVIKSKNRLEELHKRKRLEKGLQENQYISNITDFIRDSIFKEVKFLIFEIDAYTCNLCLEKGGNLIVHHIYPINLISSYDKKENFKSIYRLDNLVTLCHNCHKEKAHDYNFLDIDYDIQDELNEITKSRPIKQEYLNKYNNVVVPKIEEKIDKYLESLQCIN